MNEADTCRKHVVPKLTEAGWDDAPHFIAEQRILKIMQEIQTELGGGTANHPSPKGFGGQDER